MPGSTELSKSIGGVVTVFHEKAPYRVAPPVVRLVKIAGVGDLRLLHGDVLLLHEVGDRLAVRVDLDLPVRDRDPAGPVAPWNR